MTEHEQNDQTGAKPDDTANAAVEVSATEPTPAIAADLAAEFQTADVAGDDTPADESAFDPAVDMPMYRQGMDWFVLRVASNKENGVRDTLQRKVEIEGLTDRIGRIMVPTEKTRTLKGGKQRIAETKLYPGYIFVEMMLEQGRIPQDVFFLIKETTGVGDFVGTAGKPTPMSPAEVEKMLFDSKMPDAEPEMKLEFTKGDHVTINTGPFEGYEGTIDEVMPDKGMVLVLVTIFGRQAPVELEYWQVEKAAD
jgi:transcriptional antiterminator NusG